VLGAGSNVVVADRGFDGAVLQLANLGVRWRTTQAGVSVEVAAGESWDEFVSLAAARGMAGIECLAGIPGTVGATPIQNVGAYGAEVAQVIAAVRVVDRDTLEERLLANDDCGFSYRSSLFRRDKDRYVVTSVVFELRPGGRPVVRYPELRDLLATSSTAEPSIGLVRETVLELRRSKGMLEAKGEAKQRTAGSFFLNPTLEAGRLAAVEEAAVTAGAIAAPEEVPRFPAGDGRVKVPAAWLIGAAGFVKGQRRGSVGISARHLLALVHHGGGTAHELLCFAGEIRQAVEARLGVQLEVEPVLLGFSAQELEGYGLVPPARPDAGSKIQVAGSSPHPAGYKVQDA